MSALDACDTSKPSSTSSELSVTAASTAATSSGPVPSPSATFTYSFDANNGETSNQGISEEVFVQDQLLVSGLKDAQEPMSPVMTPSVTPGNGLKKLRNDDIERPGKKQQTPDGNDPAIIVFGDEENNDLERFYVENFAELVLLVFRGTVLFDRYRRRILLTTTGDDQFAEMTDRILNEMQKFEARLVRDIAMVQHIVRRWESEGRARDDLSQMVIQGLQPQVALDVSDISKLFNELQLAGGNINIKSITKPKENVFLEAFQSGPAQEEVSSNNNESRSISDGSDSGEESRELSLHDILDDLLVLNSLPEVSHIMQTISNIFSPAHQSLVVLLKN